jgi:hypothetical protein
MVEQRRLTMFKLILAIFLASSSVTQSKPVTSVDARSYLSKYGYLATQVRTSSLPLTIANGNDLEVAIKEFQEFAGLEKTGVMDAATADKMAQPRCGVTDKRKLSAYKTHSSKWQGSDIKYIIGKYPTDTTMTRRNIDDSIVKAFKIWAEASNLRFKRTQSESEADIRYDSQNT